MALLGQSWTLTRKNILIALNRHAFATIIRAFILPVAFMVFLSYARNLFIPPSNYGISSGHPIRTLAEGLEAATGGRNTLAFVNSGLAGGDIDRVIDSVAQVASPAGKTMVRLTDETQLLETCKSSLRGATTCYGAIVFISSPTEGKGGLWNYTLRADGAFGEKIDVTKDNNDVESR
jgi:ATP-binding cassette subfamily A (ABC1) protein 3